MITGNANAWLTRFRSHDEKLILRISGLIQNCVTSLGNDAYEDAITINLIERLTTDPVARSLFHYIEYQYEPRSIDEQGIATSLGKIDMAAHFAWDNKTYLAYECKRLNVSSGTSTSSLATPYVKEGVLRFVTEQYSEGLPVGCMLGYVLNGDLESIDPKIRSALNQNSNLVKMEGSFTPLKTIPNTIRFSSNHVRSKSKTTIEIRHTLVSCVE